MYTFPICIPFFLAGVMACDLNRLFGVCFEKVQKTCSIPSSRLIAFMERRQSVTRALLIIYPACVRIKLYFDVINKRKKLSPSSDLHHAEIMSFIKHFYRKLNFQLAVL